MCFYLGDQFKLPENLCSPRRQAGFKYQVHFWVWYPMLETLWTYIHMLSFWIKFQSWLPHKYCSHHESYMHCWWQCMKNALQNTSQSVVDDISTWWDAHSFLLFQKFLWVEPYTLWVYTCLLHEYYKIGVLLCLLNLQWSSTTRRVLIDCLTTGVSPAPIFCDTALWPATVFIWYLDSMHQNIPLPMLKNKIMRPGKSNSMKKNLNNILLSK